MREGLFGRDAEAGVRLKQLLQQVEGRLVVGVVHAQGLEDPRAEVFERVRQKRGGKSSAGNGKGAPHEKRYNGKGNGKGNGKANSRGNSSARGASAKPREADPNSPFAVLAALKK